MFSALHHPPQLQQILAGHRTPLGFVSIRVLEYLGVLLSVSCLLFFVFCALLTA